jgi:uncharacterized membrane protein
MNWKLIIVLSLLGLATALLSIYLLTPTVEFLVWIGVTLVSAVAIGRFAQGRWFQHGFLVAAANTFWVAVAQVSLFYAYISTHPEYIRMTDTLPDALSAHPRRLILFRAPVIAILAGLITGLFSWIAGRAMDRLK